MSAYPGRSIRRPRNFVRTAAYAFVAIAMAALSLSFTAASADAASMNLTQSYAADPGYVGTPTTLTVTLTNPTGTGQSGVDFIDTLPANLTFADGGNSATSVNCPNGGTAITNTVTKLTVSNIIVQPNGQCIITIRVVASVAGSYVGQITGRTNVFAPADVTFTVVDAGTQPSWDVCPSVGLLFQDPNGSTDASGPTSIYQIDLANAQTSPWTLPSNPGAPVSVDDYINAIGFLSNPTGGYVWGWDITDESLVRIGNDGSIVSYGDLGIPNIPSRGFNIGDVSPSGMMYLAQSAGGSTAFAEIDLTGATPTRVTGVTTRSFNPGNGLADWAYTPAGGGSLYGVGDASGGGTGYDLYQTNITTGVVTMVAALSGIPTTETANWGAVYVAPDTAHTGASYLYASNNMSGNIYRISLTGASSEASLFIPNGPTATGNDGARCSSADLSQDWGDAPDSYGTTLDNNGPRDELWSDPSTSLSIGATNTAEDDGHPTPAANWDIGDDGVAPFSVRAGVKPTAVVTVTNTTANDAVLAGWIDLDQNGTFSSAERVTATVPAGSGTRDVTLTFPAAPAGFSGTTYGRFRLQSEEDGTISNPQPTGIGAAGEVEDWLSIPPGTSIEVAKNVVSRFATTDQFTVSVVGTGISTPVSATTTGSLTTATTGPLTATFGGTYSVSESAASGDLANYISTYSCVDTAHGSAPVASGGGTSAFVSPPQSDSIVLCTFTNTAKTAPTLTVQKNIAGRFNTGDQFTISASGNDLGAGSSATTTGSTTGVQLAVVGPLTVAGGSGYTISETGSAGANVANYTVTYSCSNNGAAAFVTGSTASGAVTVPSAGGTNVVCTFVNTPRITVAAQKNIVSRYGAGDQFTVSVTGGSITSGNTATTSGSTLGVQSNAVAGPYFAAAATSYTFAETAAVGSLSHYVSSYSCVDTWGGNTTPFANGLGASVTLQVPAVNSHVVCTFTNTALPPTVTVTKVVNGRYFSGDQFTVGITGSGITTGNTATTSGAATTATAGPLNAVIGATYSATESAAAGNLAHYSIAAQCVDTSTGATLSSGTTASLSFAVPLSSSTVTCTFTNTPLAKPIIGITKTSSTSTIVPGGSVHYTVTVTNTGSVTADGTTVSDSLPTGIASFDSWSCTAAGGAVCPTASGTGAINATITTFPAGSSLSYVIAATASASLPATVVNTATATPPTGGTCSTGSSTTPPCPATVTTPTDQSLLTVQKNIVGRFFPSDQFTLTVSGGSLAPNPTVTTTGSGTGVQSAQIGAILVTEGAVYTVTETAAFGSLTNYSTSYRCDDIANSAALSSGRGTVIHVTEPSGTVNPPNVVCAFTNTPISLVSVQKNVVTRVKASDQFVLSLAGSLIPGGTTATTSGVATGIQPQTITPMAATPGASYTAAESFTAGTDPNNYTSTYSCVDIAHASAQVAAGSGRSVTFTMPGLTAIAAPQVVCTFTNSPVYPSISIVKTSTNTSIAPGGSVTYTLVVTNTSAVAADGTTVSDPIPTGISSFDSWTCTSAPAATYCPTASGSGAISSTIASLPAGASVTYVIHATASTTPPATITNTGSATPPPGGTCSTGTSTPPCTSVVVLPTTPVLTIVKSSTSTHVTPNGMIVYRVVVSNTSNASADGAVVADPIPAGLTSFSTTCAGDGVAICPSGSTSVPGAINQTVATFPAHSALTYTVTAMASGTPVASTVNTATVTPPPGGLCGPSLTAPPCSSSVPLPSVPIVSVTKTADVSSILPGGTVHFTITYVNAGSVSADGSVVTDAVPSGLQAGSWTCAAAGGAVCPAASGAGGFSSTVATFPVGSSLVYTLTTTVVSVPPASITNTASITPPVNGLCAPGNSAPPCTASVTLSPDPIITIVKTANVTHLTPNGVVTYTVQVTNTGVIPAPGTVVSDPVPAGIAAFTTWSCAATGGAVCPTASGAGALNETIAVYPAGGSLTYTITALADASLPLSTVNTATAVPPTGGRCGVALTAPPCTSTVALPPTAQVTITKTADRSSLLPSGTIVYTVVGTNVGVVNANGSVIDDPIAAGLTAYSWNCTSAGGAVCPTVSGTGAIHETVATFPAGSTVTYTVTARVSATPGPTVTNRATITPPNGDCGAPRHLAPPCPTSVTTPVAPQVSIVKSADVLAFAPGGQIVYSILVTNTGVVPADGSEVTDPLATGVNDYSWTCTAVGTTCPNLSGTGALDEVLTSFPVGSTLAYRVVATVSSVPPALITNTATIVPPPGGLCSPANTAGPCTSTVALPGPELAFTGVMIGGQLVLAIGTLLLGGGALLVARLRRRRQGRHIE
ncbi:MAG: conserved repeat domain protein [Microbacteriaceae bacterium]|nr:conserved repeat domain protein [Microbacteriaceae bacterium]